MNAGLKAGVYALTADNDFTLLPSTGGAFNGGLKGQSTSFVGEVNITAAYQFTQDIALASDQQVFATAGASTAAQNSIDTRGDVWFHGAMISLDVMW